LLAPSFSVLLSNERVHNTSTLLSKQLLLELEFGISGREFFQQLLGGISRAVAKALHQDFPHTMVETSPSNVTWFWNSMAVDHRWQWNDVSQGPPWNFCRNTTWKTSLEGLECSCHRVCLSEHVALEEGSQRRGNDVVVIDEAPVVACEAEEATQSTEGSWRWP
jgi:hypothetical protein